MPTQQEAATRLLLAWRAGDREAFGKLVPLVYDDLRALAGARLGGERAGHTLAPTALAHEAYLRLVDHSRVEWQGRAHFLALAATTMRRILVDHARRKRAAKRGGDAVAVTLTPEIAGEAAADVDLLALDEALERLAGIDPRQARVVEARFFAGLTIEETAEALGISPATVKLDWKLARAWLFRELGGKRAEEGSPDG